MVVKEAIMTVGPQALMSAEKIPDKIKRWLPCFPHVPKMYTALHCGERLRADGLSYNLIVHHKGGQDGTI